VSSPIHVDSERVYQFAQSLSKFCGYLESTGQSLSAEVSRLGNTWQDPGFQQFRERFKKTEAMLQRFVAESRKTVPKLEDHASLITDFTHLAPPQ